jgi:hypothetical protein
VDCPECGSPNPSSAKFCSLCLTKFTAPATPDAPAAPVAAPSASLDDRPAADLTSARAGTPSGAGSEQTSPPRSVYALEAERLQAVLPPPVSAKEPSQAADVVRTIWKRSPWAIVFILPMIWWALTGGAAAGKVASIPVPQGSVLLGQVREYQAGVLGSLSEDKQALFATRVFAVSTDASSAIDYYQSGAGAAVLKAGGWVGPTVEDPQDATTYQWTRRIQMGFNLRGAPADEDQTLELAFGDSSAAADLDQAAQNLVLNGQTVMRVTCLGLALEKVEFPQK